MEFNNSEGRHNFEGRLNAGQLQCTTKWQVDWSPCASMTAAMKFIEG
jgi:hypothetical protein